MITRTIRTEQQAYALLEETLSGSFTAGTAIRFEGWPTLTLHLHGDKLDGSITPSIMKGLVEFQKGLYHSYAVVKYGNSAKRLSEREKTALEINVKVGKGSANLSAPSEDIAKHLITELVTKMTPEHVLIAVLTLIIMYFGQSYLRSILDAKKEIRLKEITDETQKAALEAMKFSSAQETERTKIMAGAFQSVPALQLAAKIADDTHTEVLKSITSADSATVSGVELTKDMTLSLVQNARRNSTDVRLDGIYRLLKLDWSEPGRFRVKVWRESDGIELDADVQDDTLTGAYKDLLKAAEWDREPIHLSINASVIGGRYRDALIVQVQKAPPRTSDHAAPKR